MLSGNRRPQAAADGSVQPMTSLIPAALVAAWALIVYGVLTLLRPMQLSPELSLYVVQPMVWLSLAALGFVGWHIGLHGRPVATPALIFSGMLLGSFQVAAWLLAGLAFGFGFSLFAHSPLGLLGNLIYAGSVLLALELSRTVLVTGSFRNPVLAVLATSLLLTWLRVPPARWAAASGTGSLGPFLGEILLPYLAEDVLASTLALAGGPLPSLAYRAMLQGYQWLFPILPQLPWTVTAFVGTMAPALSLYGFQAARATPRASGRRDLSSAWAAVGTAVVALIWFNVGLFGVRPTLISGDSMHPTLRAGDVAVIQEVSPTEIHVGDVVRFQYESVHVVHRVIEVRQTQEGLIFVTQGDANNQIDPPVPANRIDGRVVFVIRKVGWIGIKVKQALQGAS